MNTTLNAFSADVFGWTLIHSLWQSALILLMLVLILKLTKNSSSTLRYIVACFSLALFVATSVFTFWKLNARDANFNISTSTTPRVEYTDEVNHTFSTLDWKTQVAGAINANMQWIVLLWVLGAMIFSVRLIAALTYLHRLKSCSSGIENEWTRKVNELAVEIGIKAKVAIAESKNISTPIVMGMMKPIILIPIGFLNGLTTQEVETILVHELAHIKRHDYLINVLQTLVEIIFFFNPFVWIISNIIRTEREYCCDDIVLTNQKNSSAYAHALLKITEMQVASTTLVLSASGPKGELYKRIKRIMEKSFKPNVPLHRMLPAILLVLAIVMTSWLSVKDMKTIKENLSHAADTIKKPKVKKSTQVSVPKPLEAPHDEQVEIAIVPVPSMDFIPDVEAIAEMPPIPDFEAFAWLDTIPAPGHPIDPDAFEHFSEEFEKKFKTYFKDFEKEHAEDYKKMMKEMKEEFNKEFNSEEWVAFRESMIEQSHALREKHRAAFAGDESMRAHADAMRAHAEAMRTEHEMKRKHAEDMREHSEQMEKIHQEQKMHMKEMEEKLKRMEERMKAFEVELRKELIKDGYIKENEELRNIHWKPNGEIEINDKPIKESDKQKYNDLHRRFMEEKEDN